MTIQKTVEYFKEMVKGKGSYELCPCGTDDMEMTKIALAALEKQIPKKPTKEIMDNGVDISGESDIEHDFCCPVCCNVVGMFDGNENLPFADYCDNCGQALDWSDTK